MLDPDGGGWGGGMVVGGGGIMLGWFIELVDESGWVGVGLGPNTKYAHSRIFCHFFKVIFT